jgi:hypothetical protein
MRGKYKCNNYNIECRWKREILQPVETSPGDHPASYTRGTGSFPEVKRPEVGIEPPTPFSAEVKERVELYLYFPLSLHGLS